MKIIQKRRNILNLIEKADEGPTTQGNISQLKRLDAELAQEFRNWQNLSGKTGEALRLDGKQLREESFYEMIFENGYLDD